MSYVQKLINMGNSCIYQSINLILSEEKYDIGSSCFVMHN